MTTDQATFLNYINLEYIRQVNIETNRVGISRDISIYDRYLLLLKRCYAVMLNDYLNVFEDDDNNFCTEEEIQDVLDRFNHLCNSNYVVDFSITNVVTPGPGNVWDDSLIWDDTNVWED